MRTFMRLFVWTCVASCAISGLVAAWAWLDWLGVIPGEATLPAAITLTLNAATFALSAYSVQTVRNLDRQRLPRDIARLEREVGLR